MSKERTRILVVDDEEIVRESLVGLARRRTATRWTPRPTARRPSTKLKQDRWSVMLVDLKMPGMDGLQVLEAAKTDPARRRPSSS